MKKSTKYRKRKHRLNRMKTNTEYKKRKHGITQDEDKQTEEIELRKLRKSSVKVFKQIWTSTQHITEQMEGLRKWNQVAWWRQWFGRPVPTVVSVERLVGAAEYLNSRTHSPGHPVLSTQLGTPSPQRILLELRSHKPRPTTRGKSSGDFQTFTYSVTRRSTISSWML